MKKKLKTGVIALLVICMVVNVVPLSGIILNVSAAEQTVTFTDESNRGGWTKTQGNGDISFTDGEDDEGFMSVKSDDNTIFADTQTEKCADGYVEMDMKLTEAPNGGRMGIIFRYNSPTDWVGIGTDAGKWTWFNGNGNWGSVSATKNTFTSVGEKHKVRVEYRGTNMKVLVDGEKVVDESIPNLGSTKEGNIGIRLWGLVSQNYQCGFNIDNVKTGKLTAEAEITPDIITIPYEEAGRDDCIVTLKKDGPKLTSIKNGQKELMRGMHYTLDNNTITIQKEYIESIKEISATDLTFEFEDKQVKTLHLFIEKEEEVVSYTRNFSKGIDGFEMVSGNGFMTEEQDGILLHGDGLFIDKKSKELKNQEVEFTFDPLNNNCNYGVVLRYVSPTEYLYVGPAGQNSQHYTKWGVYGPNGKIADIQDSGFVLEGRVVPYKVKVRIVNDIITVYVDNEEIWNGQVNVTMKHGKTGFRTTANTGMTVQKFTQETALKYKEAKNTKTKEIVSEEMTVSMDEAFPRVAEYTLKTGEKVKGQEVALHQLEINNKLYIPKVSAEISGNTANYHVSVKEIGISFDVVFKVEGHVLSMNVKNVKESKDVLLYTLNFPRHSLISMSSKEAGAELRANNYQVETRLQLESAVASEVYSETTLAVLSNNYVAAAVSGESYKNRHEIAYQTFHVGDYTSTGIWMNEYTYRGLDGEKMYDPWTKISITGDCNRDRKVDFQDAAVILRDDCMERKIGADTVTNNWNMIAMNVGSEAQYPFLRILDNAKKMSLATDNFGQNIIIKGYQSEGHDASHPDFANYNKRAGGLEDFKTLLENSEEYNTKVGIHVNHTDVYPEAPQYDKIKTGLGAWSWYDSASQIVRENDDLDKTEEGLDGRFTKLFDTDTEKMLDTVYVDVFFGTRWPMYKLVENINGKNRNMALGTEYVDEMVSHGVFAHHIGSNFGGASNLVRIVDNNQADIFANHQLFRGAESRANEDIGIDGWQGAKNMNIAVQSFYEKILPNKFLAQYPIMQYESDNKAVLGKNNQIVTEMKEGRNVISLDGHDVVKGNQIFIPWDNGDEEEGKIYHWNRNGGSTTWTLPKSWDNVTSVTIYKLSDEGKVKVDDGVITQNENQVTINAEPKTGYVLYKDDVVNIQTADNVEWSTGSPVKDMGFDSHNFDEWKPYSTAKTTDHITIENNNLGNSHLYIKGENDGKVTQEITGLEKGQSYAVSVWCTTADGRKASIEVKNGGEELFNYMDRSNIIYGVHHNDKYQTKAQRMQVRFVAQSDKVVLTLSAAKGVGQDSVVDFDDVRVAKVESSTNPKPSKYVYWEDFEDTDQGWGAFVSTESDQSHLSQKNPVNPANTTDVIDGNYSLKVRAGDYMRTIPATVRFDSETEYTVGIDYKSSSANAFTFAVKSDKAKEAGDDENSVIASTAAVDKEGKLELKFTTGNYNDYYVDIVKKDATEYYLDNFYVQAARPINRDTLGQLIQEAKELEESDYTLESYQKMKETLKEAEAVQKNNSSNTELIRAIYKKLEKSMEELISYASAEEKSSLLATIITMKSLQEHDYKQDAQWMILQTLIKEAEELYASDKTTSPEVIKTIREMNKAKDALNPIVDRTALKAIMSKVEKVDRNAIVDGTELQTFLSEMENAKATDLKQGVTEEEIAVATEKLTNAYNNIVLKDESKNAMIAETLTKTKQKESYFLEGDWRAIQEAKTILETMQSKTGVKAVDYYMVLDKLETALGNKLNRPVIPTSVEISAKDFEITTNAQQATSGVEGPAKNAFDGDTSTIWHSQWNGFTVSANNPAWIEVDMKKGYNLNQFSYLQRPSGGENGKIQKYNLYVKTEENDGWTKVIADGTFENKAEVQKKAFDTVNARYVKIEVTKGVGNFASAAEFAIYQKASNFAVLQQVMNEIDKLDVNAYTKESYDNLQELYKDAEKMLDNLLTEQSEIDAMTEKLRTEKEGLVLTATPTDVKMLKNAVEEAKKINPKDYKDTEIFVKTLKDAEAVLQKVEAEEEVTQKEVTEAALKLTQEQAKLAPIEKPVVDKGALQNEVNNAIPDEQCEKYPKARWNTYKKTLEYAKIILAKKDATQDEVDNALHLLKDAKSALKENQSGVSDTPKPENSDNGIISGGDKGGNTSKTPKTGDDSDPLSLAGTVAVALCGVAVLLTKKRK
ncbi:endo-alpha-N-acetylgalactosaminidase family protein [Faecalimonas sp.]